MTTLAPCPSCRRHVRTDEAGCPFCARPFATPLAAPVVPRSRFTRIAAIALATGLGSGLEGCSNQAMYGAPTGEYGGGGDGGEAGADGVGGGAGGELNLGGAGGLGGSGGGGGAPGMGGSGGA